MRAGISFILLLLVSHHPASGAEPLTTTNQIETVQKAQYDELDRYLDKQIEAADRAREALWKRKFTSTTAYERSIAPWRAKLADLLGGMSYKPTPLNPREELVADLPGHKAYRVWLSAFEGVSAYGILLVPKTGQKHPALICIHGMAGTPEGVCGLTEHSDYHHRFGFQAVERGYVVFAPLDMNSGARRRWLDRKALLEGERLQGIEQFKIERVVDYLSSRPEVDRTRIGAYGISWGGRTTMYLAALDRRIKACAISGHFNDLIPKMVQPSTNYTAFIETSEDYAFFPKQFQLFNEVDIVSLICPRAVFIEQGRQDRVAHWRDSQRVFESVKKIYERLGIGDRAEYSIFDGPHEIHGAEAFAFLDRFLQPK
jgi:dienelactone hydrolase